MNVRLFNLLITSFTYLCCGFEAIKMLKNKLNKDADYTDEELVKKIVAKNDSYYFSILYDRYVQFVYSKCFTFVNSEQEAQDLTHDIFIKIFVHLKTFRGESKLSTWIYSLTYHFCIQYINKKKTEKIIFSNEISEFYAEEIDDKQADSELFEIKYTKLLKILLQLTVEDRMILLMKYQDELSVKEIMKILNLNESAVKMRLQRARKKVLELSERSK